MMMIKGTLILISTKVPTLLWFIFITFSYSGSIKNVLNDFAMTVNTKNKDDGFRALKARTFGSVRIRGDPTQWVGPMTIRGTNAIRRTQHSQCIKGVLGNMGYPRQIGGPISKIYWPFRRFLIQFSLISRGPHYPKRAGLIYAGLKTIIYSSGCEDENPFIFRVNLISIAAWKQPNLIKCSNAPLLLLQM